MSKENKQVEFVDFANLSQMSKGKSEKVVEIEKLGNVKIREVDGEVFCKWNDLLGDTKAQCVLLLTSGLVNPKIMDEREAEILINNNWFATQKICAEILTLSRVDAGHQEELEGN